MSGAEERLANDPTSELWGEHRSRYRFAAGFIRSGLQADGMRVLDVACGAGFGLEMLRRAGADAIGVDYSTEPLRAIRRRGAATQLINANEAMEVVQADAARLPLRSQSMNLVVSFETIEHVPDAAALVREVRRVLMPNGRLVLSTPNRAFGPPERHSSNPFHVREFTADELRELLRGCFETVTLFGQRPSSDYRYVPFLLVDSRYEPQALAWKALLRLPFGLRNRLALALSGRPFYPDETNYCFDIESTDGAHALLAVAR